MDHLEELERQIRERLDAATAHRCARQEATRREMEARDLRATQFGVAARHLMDDVILPRVFKLGSLFPNARVTDHATLTRCDCLFERTPEYPAHTNLSFAVSADGATGNALITYHLEILPIFFQFEGHDQLVVPLDAIDDRAVASWLEAKLLAFTDAYLQTQVVEQYQRDNMVIDPVCGMRINRIDAEVTEEYEGRKYYFCVQDCRQKFLTEPKRYISAETMQGGAHRYGA